MIVCCSSRKWKSHYASIYSSPNDLSCSSWYSNAIRSSRASDTSWCNSLMVLATTELFSRYSWILHCNALQSRLIPVNEAILDIRCSTRGGNGGRIEFGKPWFVCKLFKSNELERTCDLVEEVAEAAAVAGFEPLGGGGGGDVVPDVGSLRLLPIADDDAVVADVRRDAGKLTGPLTPPSWRRLSLRKKRNF